MAYSDDKGKVQGTKAPEHQSSGRADGNGLGGVESVGQQAEKEWRAIILQKESLFETGPEGAELEKANR